MKTTWRSELPQLLTIAAMFATALLCWSKVPDKVSVHWDFNGEVDRYGNKFEGLLLMPIIAVGLYLLFRVIPRIDPGKANYQGFAKTYAIICNAVILFFGVIYFAGVATSFGATQIMSNVLPIAVGALFLVLGNYMGKIRPNWFVGVRTPWTLSSKQSWTKTHRVAGWLFMAIGVGVIALGLVRQKWMLWFVVIASIIGLLSTLVYSYVVWKNDPERTSPAGTSTVGGNGE